MPTAAEGKAVPIEAKAPWYLEASELAIEPDRPLEEPHVAEKDSPEWCLLKAYDGARREVVDSPRPLENALARPMLLEQCVQLMSSTTAGPSSPGR